MEGNVNKLLDEIDDIIEHTGLHIGERLFFFQYESVLECTAQIRESLPGQLQRAEQITKDKEKIIADAEDKAANIVSEAAETAELSIRKAQDEARQLVSNHEVVRMAQQESQKIIDQAKADAESIRQGALEYAKNVMDRLNGSIRDLSNHVSDVQNVVQRASQELLK